MFVHTGGDGIGMGKISAGMGEDGEGSMGKWNYAETGHGDESAKMGVIYVPVQLSLNRLHITNVLVENATQ